MYCYIVGTLSESGFSDWVNENLPASDDPAHMVAGASYLSSDDGWKMPQAAGGGRALWVMRDVESFHIMLALAKGYAVVPSGHDMAESDS